MLAAGLQQQQLHENLGNLQKSPAISVKSCPETYRSPGRRRRWDGLLKELCIEYFATECWGHVACNTTQWLAKVQSFGEFVKAKLYG